MKTIRFKQHYSISESESKRFLVLLSGDLSISLCALATRLTHLTPFTATEIPLPYTKTRVHIRAVL